MRKREFKNIEKCEKTVDLCIALQQNMHYNTFYTI